MSPSGVMLGDDLLFASRILAVARAHGITLSTVATPAELVARANAQPLACVIVDANLPGLAIDVLCDHLRQHEPAPFVVAYGSHVDAATLRAARLAGCDVVLPRSQFVEVLETALPAWFGAKPSA